jgi:hypothetical protein
VRGDRVRLPEPGGRLDDRDDRQLDGLADGGDREGGRLGKDDPVDLLRGGRVEIGLVPLRPHRVHADEARGGGARLAEQACRAGPCRGLLGGGDRVLEIGDHGVCARLEGPSELPLLAARRDEERACGLELRHVFVRIANV